MRSLPVHLLDAVVVPLPYRTLPGGRAVVLPGKEISVVQHTPHRESVAVVTEEARRYGGGIHRAFANPAGMTQINIEFGDLVTAVAFTTTVCAAFAVGVELRDAV